MKPLPNWLILLILIAIALLVLKFVVSHSRSSYENLINHHFYTQIIELLFDGYDTIEVVGHDRIVESETTNE